MSSPTTPPRRTALDALHRSLGATMTDFAGWDMPLRYGSERDEHLAVRTRAGLFDLSHMGEITVSGPQAAALLNYALVGNIGSVGVGRARYTMICREDGGILDDLIVYRLADTEYLVVANASNAQVVLDALVERSAGFDAEVRGDRDAYPLLAVQGPESPGILASLTDADLDGLKYYAGLPGTVGGVPALIARTGYTGEDGFELFVKPEHAVELWQALTKAGEEKPELILDFATLTGAARVALGPDLPGLFANDDALADALAKAGTEADDPIWRLPLWAPYGDMLKSDIADINNAAESGFAGATTAALFLQKFVPDSVQWAHFDTFAWRPAAKPGRPKGGEALGLRAAWGMLAARYAKRGS